MAWPTALSILFNYYIMFTHQPYLAAYRNNPTPPRMPLPRSLPTARGTRTHTPRACWDTWTEPPKPRSSGRRTGLYVLSENQWEDHGGHDLRSKLFSPYLSTVHAILHLVSPYYSLHLGSPASSREGSVTSQWEPTTL